MLQWGVHSNGTLASSTDERKAPMTIAELKEIVGKEHRRLESQPSGNMVLSNERGPIGIGVVDALVAVVEAQDQRIAALEKRAND
jgi:hypothetical protein